MEKRILVYKNEVEYNQLVNQYNSWKIELQRLADGIKKMGVTPEWKHIKQLLNGEDIKSLISTRNISESILKELPRRIKDTFQKMLSDNMDEDYRENIGEIAERLKHIKDNGTTCVNIKFFSMENGTVVLSPEYIKQAENMYCVFVETEEQKNVYEKYLKLQEAAKEFDDAVSHSNQRDPNISGVSLAYRSRLQAFGSIDNICCLVYQSDGKLKLKGENFGWIL